jgi:predicted transcriptional regulator
LVLKLLTDKELEILAFLARNPGRSAFQISVELKITQSTVYKALNRLAREGIVKARKSEGSETWSAISQREFRDIFSKAVDGLAARIYK